MFTYPTTFFRKSEQGIPTSGLFLDLDPASLSLSNGNNVTSWTDSSSNAHVFSTGTAPSYHTNIFNGLPAVRFDSSNSEFLESDLNSSFDNSIFTVFFVFSSNGSSINGGLIGDTANAPNRFLIKSTSNTSNFSVSTGDDSNQFVVSGDYENQDDVTVVVSILKAGGSGLSDYDQRVNNVALSLSSSGSSPSATISSTDFRLGGPLSGGTARYVNLDLGRLLIYDVAKTSQEITDINATLSSLYA